MMQRHERQRVPCANRSFHGETVMFKRIFVAIDGSRTSERAFAAALDLAVTHQAIVQPYYVVEAGPMYFDVPGYDPSSLHTSLMEQGASLAREAADQMKARGVTGEVVTVEATASDDVATLITQAANAFNADLLIMGTQRLSAPDSRQRRGAMSSSGHIAGVADSVGCERATRKSNHIR
jgi:nucleotide-binding universal stress UspA family protein